MAAKPFYSVDRCGKTSPVKQQGGAQGIPAVCASAGATLVRSRRRLLADDRLLEQLGLQGVAVEFADRGNRQFVDEDEAAWALVW